jgi:hypothetical protein
LFDNLDQSAIDETSDPFWDHQWAESMLQRALADLQQTMQPSHYDEAKLLAEHSDFDGSLAMWQRATFREFRFPLSRLKLWRVRRVEHGLAVVHPSP